MRTETEVTLEAALQAIKGLHPIKVTLNNVTLYNDYDDVVPSGIDADSVEVYGEVHPPLVVIPNRLHRYDEYVVTSINIRIVQHHHCVVAFTGRHDPQAALNGTAKKD